MSDEMEEEMQDLRDELDEKQGQLELAAQMGADLVETNEQLEEDLEELRQQLGEKEEEIETQQEQMAHAAEFVEQYEERNARLTEEVEEANASIEEMEHRVKEMDNAKKVLTDENAKFKETISSLEATQSESEQAWDEERKSLEKRVTEMEEANRREDEAAAAAGADDEGDAARQAEFQATGRTGRRAAVQLADFANEQAVRRLTAELEKLQSQLTSEQTAREEEAKGRREATAESKRLRVSTENAQKEATAAARREQDLKEEQQRMVQAMEKDRVQIGSQQSKITGMEAEIVRLNQIAAFSSEQKSAGPETANEEQMDGMVSLMDELTSMDNDTMQQEREMLEKQIRDANARADAAQKAQSKLQRELDSIEASGTSGDRKLQAEVDALKEKVLADKAKISELDEETQRLQAEVTDATARADGLESSMKLQEVDVQDQQAKLEALEAERSEMTASMKDMRSNLDTSRTEALEKDTEIMKLKRQAKAGESRIEELEEEMKSGGGDADVAALRGEVARLRADSGREELEQEVADYRETSSGLMEINKEQREDITALYSEQAKVQADRQADSRENADLRTQLSKRETEVLQLQEKVNAAQREVETWRLKMKKVRMQVLLAQGWDDEVQSLKSQQVEGDRRTKELESRVKDNVRQRESLEDQLKQSEGLLLQNRQQAQKQQKEIVQAKKEYAVTNAKLKLLQGRRDAEGEGTDEGGKKVKDIMFEHFHLTAEGILMNHPLLAEGDHNIVKLYEQTKADGVKFQHYHTWLRQQFTPGSRRRNRAGEADDADDNQLTLGREDKQMLTQGTTFEMYRKTGRMARIKKQAIHLRITDLEGETAVEWTPVNAKSNQQPERRSLTDFSRIELGGDKDALSRGSFKGVGKKERRALCFTLVGKKASHCLDLQVSVGGTVGRNQQSSWTRTLRFVLEEAAKRQELEDVRQSTSGIYEVLSPASVRAEMAARSERVAVLEVGRRLQVLEVKTVESSDLPLELQDRSIETGRVRARVAEGWVSLVSADGTELLRKSMATTETLTSTKSFPEEQGGDEDEDDEAEESDDGAGIGSLSPAKSRGSRAARASAPLPESVPPFGARESKSRRSARPYQ